MAGMCLALPSRPSARRGVEWANYYSPAKWLVFDGDLSWSPARFTEFDPVGQYVPEAVGTVVSAGATIDGYHRPFGSVRWRYFGPRTLIEDNSAQSSMARLKRFSTISDGRSFRGSTCCPDHSASPFWVRL